MSRPFLVSPIKDGKYYCSGCKEYKNKSHFHKNNNRSTGISAYCKQCISSKSKKYDNKRNNSCYKRRYGIGIEEYLELYKKQNGLCAICGKKETKIRNGKVYKLSVDHNHTTGNVRALLCNNCNHLIGSCLEDKSILKKAIGYIESYFNA